MKAVFTTKRSSAYDDLPEFRYHFPKSYLRQVEQAVGDWIIYYESRRNGGIKSYYATAKLDSISEDVNNYNHYYAHLSNYIEFPRPVAFNADGEYFERMLQKQDGTTNKGSFGRSVRILSDGEFDRIWRAGFGDVDLDPSDPPPLDSSISQDAPAGVSERQSPYEIEPPDEDIRRIIQTTVSRPFREKAFAALVKRAYDNTCALTGLKIINGGGRSEVQAAHIRPVEHNGPDSIRNGLALSGTAHWMFDRGLVSIDDNYDVLIAKDRLPDAAIRLLAPDRKLILPSDGRLRPHAKFLQYHRNEIFKG